MLVADAFGGFVAGVTGTLIGFPLDTIKTRMQVTSSKGMIGTGAAILRQEGAGALFKGMAIPLFSLSVLNTLNFTSYNLFKSPSSPLSSLSLPPSLLYFISGALVGPLASTISTPEHMLKTQLQLDNSRPSPLYSRGVYQAFRSFVRSNGFSALYVGHRSNTVRESVFLGVYFSVYETLKGDVSVVDIFGDKLAVPVAGGTAGMAGWIVSLPLDCIKATVMGNFNKNVEGRLQPTGILTVGRMILEKRGVAGLYSGMTPSLIRAFLVSGSRFTAFEIAVSAVRSGEE